MKTIASQSLNNPGVIYSSDFSNGENKYPIIRERCFDPGTSRIIEEYQISHSFHSYLRAKNRGFSTKDIWLAIDYGEIIQKQGLVFYIVLEKNLPSFLDKKIKERINNLVVITNGNCSQILTCYKSKSASKHINRKSHKLYKAA